MGVPMTRTFDLVVIGSGSAAGGVASRCRRAGWRVAMLDLRPVGRRTHVTIVERPARPGRVTGTTARACVLAPAA